MTIAAKYGKPDLFITITCNPAWSEITNNLRPNQSWRDSPHLVTRVFWQYLQNIVLDLWENGILGRSVAMFHVIEFQKRGLPHAHLVLTFEQDDSSGMLLKWTLSFLSKYQVTKSFPYCMKQFKTK